MLPSLAVRCFIWCMGIYAPLWRARGALGPQTPRASMPMAPAQSGLTDILNFLVPFARAKWAPGGRAASQQARVGAVANFGRSSLASGVDFGGDE